VHLARFGFSISQTHPHNFTYHCHNLLLLLPVIRRPTRIVKPLLVGHLFMIHIIICTGSVTGSRVRRNCLECFTPFLEVRRPSWESGSRQTRHPNGVKKHLKGPRNLDPMLDWTRSAFASRPTGRKINYKSILVYTWVLNQMLSSSHCMLQATHSHWWLGTVSVQWCHDVYTAADRAPRIRTIGSTELYFPFQCFSGWPKGQRFTRYEM